MNTNRRHFLGLVGAATLLPSYAAHAQTARAKLRVKLNWIKNSQYAGEWLAADQGYFEKEGLDVTFDAGGPNTPQAVVAVAGGSSDIGYSGWFPFLDALTQGNQMVAIAAAEPKSPLGILSLARKPILKPADLLKSKILIQGANQKAAVEATLTLNGLPNDYTAVPAGFSPEPLVAGQGDDSGGQISVRSWRGPVGIQFLWRAARQSSGDDARHLCEYPH